MLKVALCLIPLKLEKIHALRRSDYDRHLACCMHSYRKLWLVEGEMNRYFSVQNEHQCLHLNEFWFPLSIYPPTETHHIHCDELHVPVDSFWASFLQFVNVYLFCHSVYGRRVSCTDAYFVADATSSTNVFYVVHERRKHNRRTKATWYIFLKREKKITVWCLCAPKQQNNVIVLARSTQICSTQTIFHQWATALDIDILTFIDFNEHLID